MSRRVVPNGASKAMNKKPSPEPVDKQARLLGAYTGHFSMIRALHLADFITELNGLCGIMSVFSSLRHCLSESAVALTTDSAPTTNLWLAVGLPALGLFFDFLDGRVARWRKKASLMGQELDSLADLISFGVAPAVLAFTIGMRSTVDQLLLSIFVLCGLTRLARFNVTVTAVPKDETGKSKYFEGTPIPTSLAEVSVMGFWVSRGWIMENLPLGILGEGTWWEVHTMALLFVLHGCLMCSKTLHVPKP